MNEELFRRPLVVLIVLFVLLWLAAQLGVALRKGRGEQDAAEHEDMSVVLTATLTLLALIIGFSFSMAASRYDLRKNYEEQEANAIGTEYVRAGLLPSAEAAKTRVLLEDYLRKRVLFYTTDAGQLDRVNAEVAQLQNELWAVVQADTTRNRDPVTALAVAGMNDVLNSQSYTQAAFWNRIPIAAWILMAMIALFGNVLYGYTARRTNRAFARFVWLPLILAFALFLLADLDSPRAGVIRVVPQNLQSLAQSLGDLPSRAKGP